MSAKSPGSPAIGPTIAIARALSALGATGARDPGAAAREILERPEFQRELPPPPDPSDPPDLSWLLSVLEVLGWILLAVIVALIAIAVAQALIRRRREAVEVATDGETGRREDPEILLPDHAKLASEGRFPEAIHALLLKALSLLAGERPWTAAHTSREIAREATLTGEARRSLDGLVLAVEVSLFGGRPSGEPEYRDTLADYEAFARAREGAGS